MPLICDLQTGATDGIGKGYCWALAAKGINIIMVSRSPDKLQKVKSELQSQFPQIDVRCITHDFSMVEDEDEQKFRKALQSLFPKIGILVSVINLECQLFDCFLCPLFSFR